MFRRIFIVMSLCLAVPAVPAGAAGEEPVEPAEAEFSFSGAKEFLPARMALVEGRHDEALALLEDLAKGEHREEALLWQGNTFIRLGRHQEALAPLIFLIKEFPEGRFFHKARFLKAEALAGLKRFDEAAAIYEEEIAHLISKDRKEEIAQYYLKYADALAAKDREDGPQYERAIELYRRALELEIPGLIDEEIRFKIAAGLRELGRFAEEEQVLVEFKKRHPESSSLDEVDFLIAEAQLAQGRQAEARKSYREFLRDHPGSVRAPEARYGIARSYNVPEPRSETELSLGVKALEEFLEHAPEHKLAPKARFEAGMSYMNRGRLDEAVAGFQRFLEIHGDDASVEQLPLVRYNLARCYASQKKFAAALAAFKEFLARHPAHGLWEAAQRDIVVTEYEWCVDLLREKKYDQARNALLDFVRDHPLDERTAHAYYLLGHLEKEREDYQAAIREWERLVSKYQGSDLASQAQFNIGSLYETKLGDLKAALAAYEKVDFGSHQDEAQLRIQAMKAETLKVVTEKAFTTDETPRIKVTTRNIETLSMRVYAIDLEDYFIKRGTIFSVEDLDINLIEAETKWTHTVEGFAPYAEISREAELPFREAGAYVVNVSDEERTATALVLVTDLQMIVKSGREDVLVFVENVRSKEPFEGAEVIVSSGGKVLMRGRTGADGVFHKADAGLAAAGALSVLAANGGHFASNNLDLKGVAAAEGLKPKAYLFTDKPIYKPGQTVRLKGFVREAVQGRYAFAAGDGYAVALISPDGRAVAEHKAALDDFGAVAVDFALADSAPYGTYRAELKARSGWTQSREFMVGEYVPPKVAIKIDLPADVYYQGEVVNGAFEVFYNYGEPAAGKTVRYTYGTGVVLEGAVDEKGRVPFEIDTRDFGGSGEYQLAAEVLDEHAAARKILHISDTGFSLEVSVSRSVVLSGEQMTVEVRARKPDGKPAAADAELRVIYLEKKDGILFEKEVQRIPNIVIDKESGTGTAALALVEGGDYRLRAAARDRFDNLITSDKDIFVSGEEDKVKLRIFADAAAYDAGTEAAVRLHTRTEPGLALITCEGERIFHYEVRPILQGDNRIELAIAPDLAPNFTLSAALMEGSKLHKAEADLNVRSSLQVTLEPAAAEAAPGSKVRVKVRAQDRTGRPVQGQFAVAAVDAALLARFPDETEPIHEFFFGRKREGRLLTDSSCAFEYQARTDVIDSALREEEELRRLRTLETADFAKLEDELEEAAEVFEGDAIHEVIGIGGAAGKAYGGRARRPEAAVAERARKSDRYAGPGDSIAADLEAKSLDKLKSLGYGGGAHDAPAEDAFLAFDDKNGIEVIAGYEGAWLGLALQDEDPETQIRRRFLETAYWNADVRTGPDGTAEVDIELPDNTTTWKLLARGLTRETIGGGAESEVRARKELFVELRVPSLLTEEDESRVTARLVNASGAAQRVEVDFILDGPVSYAVNKTPVVELAAGASGEVSLPITATGPGLITIRVEARAQQAGNSEDAGGVLTDAVSSALPVKPMGVEILAGKGGTAAGSQKVEVALPEREYVHRYMEITVGPSFSDFLVHMADSSYRFCCLPTFTDLASQALVKLHALDYIRRSGHPRSTATARLQKETADLLTTLYLAQREDGSIPWIRGARRGDGGQSSFPPSALATAQALKAMGIAREMGFDVPEGALVSAAAWIDQHQRKTSSDEKAFFLDAYAHYAQPDFTFLNSLFRNRSTLSDHGLALLSLAFQRSGHKDNARILAELLIEKGTALFGEAKPRETTGDTDDGLASWLADDYMTLAHLVSAVAHAEPRHPLVKAGVERLMNAMGAKRRTGPGHAAAAGALAEYLAAAGLADSRYTLDIAVNGRRVHRLEVAGPHAVTTFAVPVDAIAPGDNEVAFEFEGRGEYTWTVRMSGFTRDTEPRPWREARVSLKRSYLMAPLLYEGREISPGFSTVDLPPGFKQWEHDLEELAAGETALVRLEWGFERQGRSGDVQPFVITDTLPAGCAVVESGIAGRFDHYEIGPGTITFYVTDTGSNLVYPIYAAFPGRYRSPPATMRSTYDPDSGNHTRPFALPVGERGMEKTAEYRWTPDELYRLGVALYEDGDREGALHSLEQFLTNYAARDEFLLDAARKLFRIAFDSGDEARLIRYFELLRERAPSLALAFTETARVGSSYHARGEHEQALQIFAMAAGSSFGREAQVARSLEQQGEVGGSLLFLADLIRTYPDLPEIQTAFFALSQSVLDKAGPAGGRPAIRGVSRTRVVGEAVGLLIDFLAAYPRNPIADEAAYSLVSALLDLERSEEVVKLCPLFRQRWPGSRYGSSMQYAEAYALFEVGRYDAATELLSDVADRDPEKLDPEGRDNRELAVYILGQIEHAGGRIAAAIEYYKQVAAKFADAAEAVEFFTRKSVSLPETAAFRSGEKVKIELKYRNVPNVVLSIYKVDLMKLLLMRKSLVNVTDINLAGISPTVVTKVELGDGKDYKDMTREIELPLAEKGAYMAVVQGEAAGCTGMILITDLDLAVQEEAGSGRVRVNVKDRETGAFLRNVYVKVIGSDQSRFVSGYTDLRGVFVADAIAGTSTVIAEREGEYAFHRGRELLAQAPEPQQRADQELQPEKDQGRFRALQNVFSENREMQQRGRQTLDELYQQDYQNVQIK